MKKIDLNCDLGESFGAYKIGMDEEVIKYISSANVACGFHASDPVVMDKTVKSAKLNGIAVGAHPGFPDLMGFGRRNMNVSPSDAKAYVQYQVGALNAFCTANGVKLAHVKPHGALYNMAGKDYALSKAICEGIYEIDPNIILLGLSGSQMLKAAADTGLRCAKEVLPTEPMKRTAHLWQEQSPAQLSQTKTRASKELSAWLKRARLPR